MATAVAASNDVMEEYDPDNDPLFGRLVSLRVDEPGHSWRDGIVAHVHTEVVDGIERATGVYMVVWGKFDRTEDVMRIPAKNERCAPYKPLILVPKTRTCPASRRRNDSNSPDDNNCP